VRKNRIYADTSVFGGIVDDEFKNISLRFFDEVRRGRHSLILSEVTARELQGAPLVVRQFIADLPEDAMESLAFSAEMLTLRSAYLKAKVVARRWGDDAAHVAACVVELPPSGQMGQDQGV
jgi:hypothetical protein